MELKKIEKILARKDIKIKKARLLIFVVLC